MVSNFEAFEDSSNPQLNFLRRQQLLSRVALAFSLIVAVFTLTIFVILPGIKPGKIIAILAVIGFAVISRASLKPSLFRASAISMVVLTMLAGFAGSLTNGGLEGYVAPIMITSPIAAALFLGTRETIVSAISVVVGYTILLLIEPYGIIRPEPYPEDVTSIAALVLLAMATAFCAAGLAYFSNDSKEKIKSLTDAQNQLKAAADHLEHAAHHDPLTGLANRQKLQLHIEATIQNADKSYDQICVIHIDLDRFKEVNDMHGHPVGDGVLRKAAERMLHHCDDADLVARIGGDEFVIVTTKSSESSVNNIQSLCDAIIEDINLPILVNGVRCSVGASIGYVISDLACSAAETLITNADIALYASKRSGRGVAHQFTGEMRKDAELQRTKLADLKLAFHEDRITCVLQPQICFKTGALIGMEALGRIATRTGQLMVPADFLDVLEDVCLIDTFDAHVMRKALDALVAARAAGHTVPRVAVNASAKSLRSPGFVEAIQQELLARGLKEQDLSVEILESTLIEDRDDVAAKTIERLTQVGINTAIDDFGSGHASMWALLELKIDVIKIDRSLISNIECERSRTVIEAVITLSNGLDLATVVEGVETPQQFSILKSLGCDAAQGFGLCKPLQFDDLCVWLDSFGRSDVSRIQDRIRQSRLAQ